MKKKNRESYNNTIWNKTLFQLISNGNTIILHTNFTINLEIEVIKMSTILIDSYNM